MSEARLGIRTDTRQTEASVKSVQGLFRGLAADAKQSILTGVGLGAGVTAFNLLGGAVGKVTDLLGDAVHEAIADEESVNRLTAALKANVPAWDGNTAAIEKRILAGQKLGFTDEELRNSLTLLVGATKDVEKAQQLQSAAMDLARFKNIDLATASDALVKVEGGRFRILASLGIKLREGATQTEVLAAIQKVAAGQAKVWGDSTAGAAASAGIAFDELKEDIGTEFLPVVKEVAEFARDDLIPAIRDTTKAVADAKPVWDVLGFVIGRFVDGVKTVAAPFILIGDVVGRVTGSIKDDVGTLPPSFKEMSLRASRAMQHEFTGGMGRAAAIVEAGADDIAAEAGKTPKKMANAMLAEQQELKDAVADLVKFTAEALTPLQERAEAEAFLASDAYANAIASGKPAAIARANELRAAALAALGYVGGAWTGGMNLATAWKNGLISGLEAAKIEMIRTLGIIKDNLYGDSPPKKGPLKDIDKGAFNIGRTWSESFVKGIGPLKLPTLPDLPLAGGAGRGGLAVAAAAMGGGMGSQPLVLHVHVDLDGREITENVSYHQSFQRPDTGLLPR